jgi:hypothetical protein
MTGLEEIIDCCIVIGSSLTSLCQEGDIIIRINDRDCTSTPTKPSDIMSNGTAGMLKAVEHDLNRERGTRTVRFMRLADFGAISASKVVKIRHLDDSIASLLMDDSRPGKGTGTGPLIDRFIVDNNGGNKSIRNSIARIDSLTFSLSLLMSPIRKFSGTNLTGPIPEKTGSGKY